MRPATYPDTSDLVAEIFVDCPRSGADVHESLGGLDGTAPVHVSCTTSRGTRNSGLPAHGCIVFDVERASMPFGGSVSYEPPVRVKFL